MRTASFLSRLFRSADPVAPRRRWPLVAVVLVALGLGAAIGFGPAVRAYVVARGDARGLAVRVASVRLGLWRIWLGGVQLSAAHAPGIELAADSVELGVFGRGAFAHGVRIALTGTAEQLGDQLRALRGGSSGGSGGSSLELGADGVSVIWRLAPADAPRAQIWGLRYRRTGVHEGAGADLVRWNSTKAALELRKPAATWHRTTTGRVLDTLGLGAGDLRVSLEPRAPVGSGKLGGSDETSFVEEPSRGPALRAVLRELGQRLGMLLPEGSAFELGGLRARLERASEQLNLGPSVLRMVRRGSGTEFSLVPGAESGGTRLELKAALPTGEGEVSAEVSGGPVSLAALGVREGDMGLIDVERARLEAHARLALAADGSQAEVEGAGELRDLSLFRRELGPTALRHIALSFRGRGEGALDGSHFALDEGELSLGEVHLRAHGSLDRSSAATTVDVSGGIDLAACQALLDAVPAGLAPVVSELSMSGTFALQGEFSYDSRHLDDSRVRLRVANDCRITEASADLLPTRFAGTWSREVRGADGLPELIESGPGSSDWVESDEISPYMEVAVLVCEDAHFFRHHGFDYDAIQNSIRENLARGRFVRGASTISMQLAKNLYLDREKTLGRKLQEALLTMLLEQELDKRSLLELYLNVIEYGPGIYGIGPAAQYYFNKRARDLSLGQALYIASILPNPDRQHFAPDGRVTAAWTKYLRHLMRIAYKIHRISAAELDAGLAEQLAFREPGPRAGAEPGTASSDADEHEERDVAPEVE